MSKPTVFLDVDEIVASLHPLLYQAHGRVYDPEAEIKGRAAWDLEKIFDIPWADLWKPITYDMVLNLPKTPEADEIIRLLSPPGRPWDIVFITNPMPVHVDARVQWMKNHWPEIPTVLTSMKHLCCKGPQTLLIDDFDDNCDRWKKEGGRVIRFPRPWNTLWAQEKNYFPHTFKMLFQNWIEIAAPDFSKKYRDYCFSL